MSIFFIIAQFLGLSLDIGEKRDKDIFNYFFSLPTPRRSLCDQSFSKNEQDFLFWGNLTSVCQAPLTKGKKGHYPYSIIFSAQPQDFHANFHLTMDYKHICFESIPQVNQELRRAFVYYLAFICYQTNIRK